jgi:hypothetical protein
VNALGVCAIFVGDFQGLETGTGGFSKDWKISRKFSRALEKKVAECSKAWKTGGARTWN